MEVEKRQSVASNENSSYDELANFNGENEPSDEQQAEESNEGGDGKGVFSKIAALPAFKLPKNKQKPKASTAHKLEDQMNFEHLKKLETIFQEADADGGGGLDIDEFREAMKKTMGSEIDDKELEILFMKVDTNCDGTVDWDEYLSYMLLEYQEKDTMTSLIKEVPFPNPVRELISNHRDFIVSITFFQSLSNRHANKASDRDNPGGKYLVLSKEGQLGFYSIDYELQKSITIAPINDSCVPLWLTDLAPCPNVNMVAVSSSEREISFYDVGANKFERQFQLTGFRDAVLCLNYWFDHENLNHCTLVAGDSCGCVIVFRFFHALRKGLFDLYPQKGVVRKIPMISVVRQKVQGVYCLLYPDLHTNWVNCAKYFQLAQGLECFISCSATDDDSMYLGDLTNITYKPKWPGFTKLRSNRGCYYKVRKGIIALDYSKEWNIIVTGSFDGVVRTWNPYSAKPASLIKGHMTPVQHVIIMSKSGQIIAFGRDRSVRIIELRDHTTTQVIGTRSFAKMGPISHPINAVYYQKRYKALLLGSMQIGLLEGFDDNEKVDQMNIKSHEGAVSTVLYNKLFNQVVTGGHDSVLSVWDLNTGTKAIQFHTIKGVELTCMCFDPTGRRLISGSRNGAVKIWNFNNGACLRTLCESNNHEVTGIVCLKQKIITGGWNKKLSVHIDSRDEGDLDESRDWEEAHRDDILCLATFIQSNGVAIVASSSYDGDIFIWSFDSGHILCRLNRMQSYSPLSSDGFNKNRRPTQANVSFARPQVTTVGGTVIQPPRDVSLTNGNASKMRMESAVPRLPPVLSQDESSGERADVSKPGPTDQQRNGPGPSAGVTPPKFSKEEHTRHQLGVLLGEDTRDYWEADVSVDKLIFLQSRPHKPHTATLLSSGALGWVHAWSIHPQGGLLGQFVAAHRDGDSVIAMATDQENKILITGDSHGYIKIWDVETYCCDQPTRRLRRGAASDLLQIRLNSELMDEESTKMLSARRMMKLNIVPPNIHVYFRAHVDSINDVHYIQDKKLILTACSDGSVRLWTITGSFVGTFGQKHPWNLSSNTGGSRMPADIKRVASANTLKVFNAGYSAWRLAKNVLNFVVLRGVNRQSTAMSQHRPSLAEAKKPPFADVNSLLFNKVKSNEEIDRDYERTVERMKTSTVLGGAYKPKRRHRVLPKIDLKPHMNNFHVHSAIPFSPLEATEDIQPPELLKEKWRLQKEMMQIGETDVKPRSGLPQIKGIRSKRTLTLPGRKKKSSRATFLNASNKVTKVVRIVRTFSSATEKSKSPTQ